MYCDQGNIIVFRLIYRYELFDRNQKLRQTIANYLSFNCFYD